MFFASDNTGPTHPAVLQAVIEASDGYALPYGNDPWAARAQALVREVFEAPDASVHLAITGTGANSMIMGAMAPPWSAIFCHEMAHILIDEANGPQMYSGGASFAPVPGAGGKMSADGLRAILDRYAPGDVHTPARGPISLTNITEAGTAYSLSEIEEIAALGAKAGLAVHLDGARFSNACAALGCTAAELTWKSGVTAATFGGTKNGCMSVEAAVFFDPAYDAAFLRNRMRGGHLLSKHRILSAQMVAYLTDGLWLTLGAQANAAGRYLADGIRAHVEFVDEPAGNLMFVRFPRALHRKLHAAGAQFNSFADVGTGPDDEPIVARFVCDWSATPENTDRFVDLLKAG
ncbi:MAG: beta-eliminating lyase-related protein [Pseudomonadota bacterium]